MIHKPEFIPQKRVAESTVRRLAVYLHYLETLTDDVSVSSDVLASLVGTTPAQVRKDLSFFGSFGKRGKGYSAFELVENLREILGTNRTWRVCIVGAGKIGLALAQYPGFTSRGFCVVGIYDSDPSKIGKPWDSISIRDIRELKADADAEPFDIGVIAVPGPAGQEVADILVSAGLKAIMNFAPVQISAPPDVVVRMVNMVIEFEGLSFALTQRGSAGR